MVPALVDREHGDMAEHAPSPTTVQAILSLNLLRDVRRLFREERAGGEIPDNFFLGPINIRPIHDFALRKGVGLPLFDGSDHRNIVDPTGPHLPLRLQVGKP